MTTGIYQLTFPSGKIYIGQSVDMETRWKQHADKFRKGTAAKPMQAEFNRAGFPSSEVLLVCHKDHLDMMESMYINARRIQMPERMLNTSIPKDYTNAEIYTITKNEEYLKYSIVQLIHQASSGKANLSAMQEELDALHEEGIQIPPDTTKLVYENKLIKEQYAKLVKVNQMLSLEASKSWWQKLLS
jgi:hypothetical protein